MVAQIGPIFLGSLFLMKIKKCRKIYVLGKILDFNEEGWVLGKTLDQGMKLGSLILMRVEGKAFL